MKTPLLLIGICAGFSGMAQSIELGDTISTGDAMTYYVLDSSYTSYPDVTGAGATWDYSDIGSYGLAPNVNNVIDGVDSDFAAEFPMARYAEAFENSVNTFFTPNAGASQTIVHGFVFQELENDFIIKYDVDPLISYKYPMVLGDTYTDEIEGTAVVPLAGDISIAGEATITADGTGTIVIGDVNYTNVIRVHTTEVSEGVILGSAAIITRESYVYYDIDNFNMPIFIHADVLAEMGVAGEFGFTAVYSKDDITDHASIKTNASLELSVYPNPALGDFTTITMAQGTESLVVLSSLGQVITTIKNPKQTENINVSELNTGIYFIQVTKGNATRTEKLIVR